MITEAELARMKALCATPVTYTQFAMVVLLREVEELTTVANAAADEIDALRRTVDLYAKEKEELRAALSCRPDGTLKRCAICGFIVDTKYAPEKPTLRWRGNE